MCRHICGRHGDIMGYGRDLLRLGIPFQRGTVRFVQEHMVYLTDIPYHPDSRDDGTMLRPWNVGTDDRPWRDTVRGRMEILRCMRLRRVSILVFDVRCR